MYSWSNDVFVELMGEEDAKTRYCTWGTVFSPVPIAKEEQRREWIVKICRKNTPIYTKHRCLWCPLRWRETSRYFSFKFPARFVWTQPAKKERLSHVDVSQAARPRDEVDMEVDGNISREAGRLRIDFQRQLMKRKIPQVLFGRQR